MILKITPNIEELVKKLSQIGMNSDPAIQRALDRSQQVVYEKWQEILGKSKAKRGWKEHYSRKIEEEDVVEKNTRTVSVNMKRDQATNMYVNFIENGISSWSIKEALLNGPHSQKGKNGRYNIVFMRKNTPGSSSPAMSSDVYSIAKGMISMKETLADRVRDISSMPGSKLQSRAVSVSEQISSAKGKREHLGRMMKGKAQKTKTGNQHAYGVFFRVGENSKGWVYPDIPKVPVFSRVKSEVEDIVKDIFLKEIQAALISSLNKMNNEGIFK